MKKKYIHTGLVPVDLEGGRIVAPGEEVTVDDQVSHDRAYIDNGLFVPVVLKNQAEEAK